jgi:hypothetical protein
MKTTLWDLSYKEKCYIKSDDDKEERSFSFLNMKEEDD